MDQTEYASPTAKTYRRLRLFSRIFSVLVILIGILVWVGWLSGSEFLKRIRPTSVAMNPVTALGIIIAGIALYMCQQRNVGRYNRQVKILAYILIGIGFLKIVLLLSHLNFPFDQLVFRDQLWEPFYHTNNSLAPNTAINFILIGFALIYINFESKSGRRPSQYIAIVAILISLVSLYGYVYQISALYTITTYFPMAPHTAFSFLCLSAGILFARPDKGSMAIVIGESSSQIIFMRFLAMVLPLIFGWLKLQGEYAGYYSKEAGTAMFAVLAYVFAMYLLGRRSVLQHKIRETKRIAMDKIKENERRLQAILDQSGANISLKTLLGKYTLINKQFEKDFGREAGNVLGKTDYDLFPREIARELNQYDHQIIRTGQPKSFEEKYPQEDGLHTYITVKFPLFNQDNKIYALGAVSTDITKRKHLEEELRKSHQRLFSILNNVGEGVIVADKAGNLLIFNRRAEEILGTGAVNVPLEAWNKTYGFYQEDGKTYFSLDENPLFKALKGETADNVEMLVKNDYFKEEKWIAVTGRPVLDVQNEVIAGVIVFREITLRKQMEKRFSENEHRLKLILASIGEGVIIIDKDGHVLLFNKKAEEILGTGPWDLPLARWPAHYGIYEVDGSSLFRHEKLPIAQALQGNSVEPVEVLIRNEKLPEGSNIYLNGKPIRDNSGKISGVIIDLKDITEQRKLEEYLKEMKDQFYELMNQRRPL